jgi:formamidopyrimidine-DNA glycosylase
VISLEDDLYLIIHLMVAGRLKWLAANAKPPKSALAVFEFESGILVLTEAGTRRRASLHFVSGESAVRALHAGGWERRPMAWRFSTHPSISRISFLYRIHCQDSRLKPISR